MIIRESELAVASAFLAALVPWVAEIDRNEQSAAFIQSVPAMLITTSANAFSGCTQEDVPAIIIRLDGLAAQAALLEIEIAGLGEAFLPVKIVLSPLRRETTINRVFARAAYLRGREPQFLAGEIVITALDKDRRISGTYKLTMPNGVELSGTFDADWKPGRSVCG
jgi:hypothetical protein